MTSVYDATNLTLTRDSLYVDPDYYYTSPSANGGIATTLDRWNHRTYDSLLRPLDYQLRSSGFAGIGTLYAAATYGYDDAGRVSTVTGNAMAGADRTFTYGYHSSSAGLIASVTGPAHTVSNTWESHRDVLDVKTNFIPGSPDVTVSAYDYTVNDIAQRSGVAFSGTAFSGAASIGWGYNSAGEVTNADHSTTNTLDRAYQYDPIGNREKSADSLTLPGSANYTGNNLNQYTAANGSGLTYDDDGNMLTDGGNNSTAVPHTYEWDGELSPLARGQNGQSARVDCPKGGRAVRPLRRQNRLITIKQTSNSAALVSYGYDALSRRITRTVGSTRTYYFYNGWNVIAEFSGAVHTSGTAPTVTHDVTHLWGLDLSGSEQGAGGVGALLATERRTGTSAGVYYPTYDGNGNVSEYPNASGAVAAHYEYDPFGRTTISTGADAALFPNRFSTKPLDGVSGLYYYGYRLYCPELGRWLNRDPIGEWGGANLFSMTMNGVVNMYDILGEAPPATAKLDYDTSGSPEARNCGAGNWSIKWKVTDPAGKGGTIIQEVRIYLYVAKCDGTVLSNGEIVDGTAYYLLGKKVAGLEESNYPYWEAFPVGAGGKSDDDVLKLPNQGKCTKGRVIVLVSAKFYPGEATPPSMKSHAGGPAGGLPVSLTDPGLPGGTEPVIRSLITTWDCCSSATDTTGVDSPSVIETNKTVYFSPIAKYPLREFRRPTTAIP